MEAIIIVEFENILKSGHFGQKRSDMTLGWRKLHSKELHNLYS
jgi:hypothetical protein